jgi:hypothetical protein
VRTDSAWIHFTDTPASTFQAPLQVTASRTKAIRRCSGIGRIITRFAPRVMGSSALDLKADSATNARGKNYRKRMTN